MPELTEQQFKNLQRDVKDAQDKAAEAKGAVKQLTDQLKEEFDCDGIEDAKAYLKKLQRQRDQAKQEFEDAQTAYQEKWHGSKTGTGDSRQARR